MGLNSKEPPTAVKEEINVDGYEESGMFQLFLPFLNLYISLLSCKVPPLVNYPPGFFFQFLIQFFLLFACLHVG